MFRRSACYIYVESIQPSGIPEFFQDIPRDLGRAKDKDDDQVDEATYKKRKKRDPGLKESLQQQGDTAQQYCYGTLTLGLQHFGLPNKNYANRDYKSTHSADLVEHWSDVGILFPEKSAVVCAFEVCDPLLY